MKVKQKKCLTSVFTCDTLAVLWNEVNSVLNDVNFENLLRQ